MADVLLREHRDADADVVFEWMRDPVAVRMAAFTHDDRDVGFAAGVGAEVEETIFRLD